ncbi:MAG TPA: ShlB/FhaC/HecB family hemolysin secretion/activation protein [Gemmatimonadaceae bacterium]|nr:ShlB/FhaC/HecB family hemolysin secretion/activation protein [Gemmatimonadaceae bacterium]
MLSIVLIAQMAAAQPAETATLVARARLARYQQDSTLAEYRTVVKQRASSGFGLSQVFGVGLPGRERLAARYESVARVGWHHLHGAWGEVMGARAVVPFVGITEPDDAEEVALVLPYHPGRDELWPISELREAMPNHSDWIQHPLETGSDSLYEFALGDSIRIRLVNDQVVQLRELIVRPRRPSEKLIVGSLWLDIASGSLVRAAYRPSVALDLWPLLEREIGNDDDGRAAAKKFGPYVGIVREVVIEHGLYGGRFWLPRVRTASAQGTAKGASISLTIEQTFTYESVRGMPPGEVTRVERPRPDIDPRDGRERRGQWYGERMKGTECRPAGQAPTALWTPDSLVEGQTRVVYAEGIRFRVLSPCDPRTLVTSSALPKSIYGDGEELFTETDFAKLRSDAQSALAMSRQAKWRPQIPVVYYGIERGLLRFNRVEGLSAGVMGERVLGDGYTASATVRVGLADLVPNAEATLWRTNMTGTIGATAYRRLSAANEWGNPLGLGPSLVAAVFGRDDGFYYRSYGAEVTGSHQGRPNGPAQTWRIYVEHQGDAAVETNRSLANLVNGLQFRPNIDATTADFAGGAWAGSASAGSDPQGTRFSAVAKTEGALRSGAAGFGRASLEMKLFRGLGRSGEATVTGAVGSSVGAVPVQHLWYLGGAHTVRGYDPGAMVGESFWLGRAEIGRGHPLIRPSVFADVGWAGARDDAWAGANRLSGYGVGFSMLEGMIRLDVARSAAGRYRADFYLDPR